MSAQSGPPAPPAADQPCHVVIEAHGSRMDVALPATMPVGELMPALLTLCGMASGSGNGSGPAPQLTLARVGEPALARTSSLEDAGVLQGEVLYVVDAAEWPAPDVTEPAEAAGDGDDDGTRWSRSTTATLIAGLAVVEVIAAAVVAVRAQAISAGSGVALLMAAVLLAGAVMGRPRHPWPGGQAGRAALAVCAWMLAALGGWGVAGGAPDGNAVAVAGLAVAAVLIGTAQVAPALAPGGALAVLTIAGAAAALAGGARPVAIAVVVVVGGVVALRLLPQLAAGLLETLTSGQSLPHVVQARARLCRSLLVSLSAASAAAVLAAVVVLAAWGDALAAAIAALATLSLLLRARWYRLAPDVLPAAAAAVGALIALGVALVLRVVSGGGVEPVLLIVVGGVLLTGLAALWTRLPPMPGPRAAGWVLIDMALAPLALGELGVFGAVARFAHHVL